MLLIKGVRTAIFNSSLCVLILTGCATQQMEYNIESYDVAIARSANELLLLNAVRASQRYPMSFTQVGGVSGSPQVGGSFDGTFNFNPIGLTTFTLAPKASTIAAGYGQFQLSNLNDGESLQKLRSPIPGEVIASFYSSGWPDELIWMLYIKSINLNDIRNKNAFHTSDIRKLQAQRDWRCANPRNQRDSYLCDVLYNNINNYKERCSDHFDNIDERIKEISVERISYFNSATTFCSYMRFQIIVREFRLVGYDLCPLTTDKPSQRVAEETIKIIEERGPRTEIRTKKISGGDPIYKKSKMKSSKICISAEHRTAMQMIIYLGELIAAQNYIEKPFQPTVLIGVSTESGGYRFVEVPLFVVKRGAEFRSEAAVVVRHEGETFYIPKPYFRATEEARSLQALDLVLATTRAATTKSDTPRTPPTVQIAN